MDNDTIARAGALLRAKRAVRGKRRRLLNVTVDEISLVDNPAVPEATFVIAKRDTSPADLSVTDHVAHAAKLIGRRMVDNTLHLKALCKQADALLADRGIVPAANNSSLDDPRVVAGFRRVAETLDRVAQQQAALAGKLAKHTGGTSGSGGPLEYGVIRGGRRVWTHARPAR